MADQLPQRDDERPTDPACNCPDDVDPRIARYFNRRNERRRTGAERYEMGNVTLRLLDALLDQRPIGQTVLEGGCGPGALLVELLKAGAARATGVDLSAEAIEFARERAHEAGVSDRVELVVGDAATRTVPAHDWVVLDKVICCYPEVDVLLATTVAAARSLYAFAVPVSFGWRGALARVAFGAEAFALWLLRRPCPAYVHDIGRIEDRLRGAGFSRVRREAFGMWYVAVFARA